MSNAAELFETSLLPPLPSLPSASPSPCAVSDSNTPSTNALVHVSGPVSTETGAQGASAEFSSTIFGAATISDAFIYHRRRKVARELLADQTVLTANSSTSGDVVVIEEDFGAVTSAMLSNEAKRSKRTQSWHTQSRSSQMAAGNTRLHRLSHSQHAAMQRDTTQGGLGGLLASTSSAASSDSSMSSLTSSVGSSTTSTSTSGHSSIFRLFRRRRRPQAKANRPEETPERQAKQTVISATRQSSGLCKRVQRVPLNVGTGECGDTVSHRKDSLPNVLGGSDVLPRVLNFRAGPAADGQADSSTPSSCDGSQIFDDENNPGDEVADNCWKEEVEDCDLDVLQSGRQRDDLSAQLTARLPDLNISPRKRLPLQQVGDDGAVVAHAPNGLTSTGIFDRQPSNSESFVLCTDEGDAPSSGTELTDSAAETQFASIGSAELGTIMNDDAANVLLIDVRPALAYNTCHLQRAVHITFSALLLRRLTKKLVGRGLCDSPELAASHRSSPLVGSCSTGRGSGTPRLGRRGSTFNGIDELVCNRPEELRRRLSTSVRVVVYNESGHHITVGSPLHVMLSLLEKEGTPAFYLRGGLCHFRALYPSLCEQPKTAAPKRPMLQALPNSDPAQFLREKHAPATNIFKFLVIGDEEDGRDVALLASHGVTHVLNLSPSGFAEGVPLLARPMHICINPNLVVDIITILPQAIAFIDACRRCQGKVFVYCADGAVVAPAIVAAYMVWTRHFTLKSACENLKMLRPTVQFDQDIHAQLAEFEHIVHHDSRRRQHHTTSTSDYSRSRYESAA